MKAIDRKKLADSKNEFEYDKKFYEDDNFKHYSNLIKDRIDKTSSSGSYFCSVPLSENSDYVEIIINYYISRGYKILDSSLENYMKISWE